MKKVIALGLCLLLLLGCVHAQAIQKDGIPRYVFLFIGDGMGLSLTTATQYYLGYQKEPEALPPRMEPLSFTLFPEIGLMSTHYATGWVTDSSAAATAMASGKKTKRGYSNLSPDEEEVYQPITRLMKDAGMKIGIVTNTAVTDGTPAGFYATVSKRSDHYVLAVQAAQSDLIDFMGGGGFRVEEDPEDKGENAYAIARKNGYRIIEDQNMIRAITASNERYFVLADERTDKGEMQYEIDRAYRAQFNSNAVSLAEIVAAAIRAMDGPEGFFLMAEGGRIDGAAHSGDAKTAMWEVIGLSDAVTKAVTFYEQHPNETLIIVTSDHETGGMYFTADMNFDALSIQDVSYSFVSRRSKEIIAEGNFGDVLSWTSRHLGMDEDEEAHLTLSGAEREHLERMLSLQMLPSEEREAFANELEPYTGYSAFASATMDILNQRAGIVFPITGHTGTRVPVYALGVGAEHFSGCYDNTMIYHKLVEIMGY